LYKLFIHNSFVFDISPSICFIVYDIFRTLLCGHWSRGTDNITKQPDSRVIFRNRVILINSIFIDNVSMLCLSGNVKTKRSEQLPNFLQKIRNNRRSNRFLMTWNRLICIWCILYFKNNVIDEIKIITKLVII
jgi:hypothetical protein